MNNNSNQESQPLYPSVAAADPTGKETNRYIEALSASSPSLKTQDPQPQNQYPTPQEVNPFHQTPQEVNPFHQTPHEVNFFYQTPQPSSSSILQGSTQETQPQTQNPETVGPSEQGKERHDHEDVPSSSSTSAVPITVGDEDVKAEKWGTHVMGHPAVPTCHPDNKKAALWGAGATDEAQSFHYPYLQYRPVEKSNNGPMESMLHVFNSWSNKAESMANNIWHNLKTGTSVSGAAWAKMNLTAKAITGGGFEALYKQTFATYPNEKLKKSFACYLSTSTGPVAGTLYLSNLHSAFCSDRPLSFTAPSGQVTWSYYKVMLPLGNIATVNPVVMRDSPTEKYIQILTVDGHDFWFMGFVNYEKASRHLTESISTFVASRFAVKPAVAVADKGDY